MDPSAPPPRTPAQAAASRLNGARSAGPVTALGKVASAANGIVHGFAAHGALMVGETPAMYEANLATWFESLRPATAGEAKLVARLADTDFRQGRLARAEERLVASSVEDQVKGSAAQVAVANATEVLAAVQGLVALAESVPPTVDADAVRRLMPAMEVVAERAGKLDLPMASPSRSPRRWRAWCSTPSSRSPPTASPPWRWPPATWRRPSSSDSWS